MHNRRGIGLVDAIATLSLLTLAAVLFGTVFPTGTSAIRQAGETRKAVAIAQQTLEQVKDLGYESLTYANLQSANLVDTSPNSSPYGMTQVASLSNTLNSPTGTLTITDDSATVKRVTVCITWKASSAATHSVTLDTLIADTRPRNGT